VTGRRPPGARFRGPRVRWGAGLAAALLCLAGGGTVFEMATRPSAGSAAADESATGPAASTISPGAPPTSASPASTISPASAPSATPAPPAPPVLRLPGAVPHAGPGTFEYGNGRGGVLGRAGALRRYRVAVEKDSGEDVDAFGAAVDLALGNPVSWIASGQLRLQRVPDGAAHEFTVYLATAETARRMCAAGGVNIRIGGKPYTSCRTEGKVIINLDRWRLSVDQYVAAGVPLDTYRLYVVNHEVGHELGHHHERCPGKGKPAPVMMQQTLRLSGCTPNPWPYVHGRRWTGPPL
jgi:hypothetical protein